MNQPWDAQFEVSAELASQLIASQFPELTVSSIVKLGSGWDNVAFLMKHKMKTCSATVCIR